MSRSRRLCINHIKKEVDEARHVMGRFVLTGSQSFALMRNISESLAGRAGVLQMEGMDFEEAGYVSVNEAILRGGYPELAGNREMNLNRFYSSYLITYLERDVRQLRNIGSLREFERFMRLLALCSGCQLDMTALAAGVGASVSTIKDWLSILEASCVISFLQPWSGNLSKRLVKNSKVYYNDTGLLCFLQGIGSVDELTHSMMIGEIWGTFVYSELRKHVLANGLNRQFYYYRENSGLEVDFLVIGNGCRLLEAKWNEHPDRSDTKNLVLLKRKIAEQPQDAFELQQATGYVACRTVVPYLVNPQENIQAIGGECVGMIL